MFLSDYNTAWQAFLLFLKLWPRTTQSNVGWVASVTYQQQGAFPTSGLGSGSWDLLPCHCHFSQSLLPKWSLGADGSCSAPVQLPIGWKLYPCHSPGRQMLGPDAASIGWEVALLLQLVSRRLGEAVAVQGQLSAAWPQSRCSQSSSLLMPWKLPGSHWIGARRAGRSISRAATAGNCLALAWAQAKPSSSKGCIQWHRRPYVADPKLWKNWHIKMELKGVYTCILGCRGVF